LGASLTLAGLSGCAQAPQDRIVPYVEQPEGIVPGRPLFFATAMPLAGYGQGLLVTSHEGRPAKGEGNPHYPQSAAPADTAEHARFGPSNLFAQASILDLYDPDRSQSITRLGVSSTLDALVQELRVALKAATNRDDQPRLRIITETVTSPTLSHQLR